MTKLFKASKDDAIKGRTLNLTLFSGLAAAIAAAITVFNDSFKSVFGDDLTAAETVVTKRTLLVAVIAAFAVIVVADMFARAWATASTGKLVVVPAPAGLTAKKIDGEDQSGFTVAAMRVRPSEPDKVEYLLVKSGSEAAWVIGTNVRLSSGG